MKAEPTICFTHSDLEKFSVASHDTNPLHMNDAYARKTAYGQRVVFGVLGGLACLEHLEKLLDRPLFHIELEFRNPMFVGIPYHLQTVEGKAGQKVVQLVDGDLVLVRLTGFVDDAALEPVSGQTLEENLPENYQAIPLDYSEAELGEAIQRKGCYQTLVDGRGSSAFFTDILMLSSYLVGMEVPGKQALYSKIKLRVGSNNHQPGEALNYQLNKNHYDENYGLIVSDLQLVKGGNLQAQAEIRAFARKTIPATQLSDIQKLLPESEFYQDKVALVTGGGRGLGASFVQALALQGCHVYLNYWKSEDEALELQKKLAEAPGKVTLVQGDASSEEWCTSVQNLILENHGKLDLLVCNACTPPTSIGVSADAFARTQSYVTHNIALTTAPMYGFLGMLSENQGTIIGVSSIYVEQDLQILPEYRATKIALETLMSSTASSAPDVSFAVIRPPVLKTDMSNTPSNAMEATNPEIIGVSTLHQVAQDQSRGKAKIINTFPLPEKPKDALVVAANFTADPISSAVDYWAEKFGFALAAQMAPYNQIFQQLLNPQSDFHQNQKGMNLILLRFEDFIREQIHGASEHDESSIVVPALEDFQETIDKTHHDLLQAIEGYAKQSSNYTLVVVCPPSPAFANDSGWNAYFSGLEESLLSTISQYSSLGGIQAKSLHQAYEVQDEIHDALRDDLGHIPYTDSYFHLLGTVAMRRYYALHKKPTKVLVLDCDNTLWRGVCGEVGAQGVEVSPAFARFQEFLVQQKDQGVLLCLCSKNVEEDVWNVFENQAAMVLTRQDLVDHQINWIAKSANLQSLAESLNLGLDSFIFIDDNPVECAEVRNNCPQVMTFQFPQTEEEILHFVEHTWEFDQISATKEDKKRTQMYQANVQRTGLLESTGNFENFIKSLNLKIELTPMAPEELPRVSQMTQRTNQFNFTTIRRNPNVLKQILEQAPEGSTHPFECYTAKVSDRFGDYGLVGVMIFVQSENQLRLDSFLLSCRVLGRGVEFQMMSTLGKIAFERNLETVQVEWIRTEKNQPARLFLDSMKFQGEEQEDRCCWNISAEQLKDLKYVPPETSVDPAKKKAASNQKQLISADSLRAHEELIYGNASQLFNLQTIAQQIQALAKKSTKAQNQAKEETRPKAPAPSISVAETSELGLKVTEEIQHIFADVLSIPLNEVGPEDYMENFAEDSFKKVELTVELKRKFERVSNTILFEHNTIASIVSELLERQGEQLSQQYGIAYEPPQPIVVESFASEASASGDTKSSTDIAIVGMNGKYPGADNLDEFWENLLSGTSSIDEVPDGRWEVNDHFHAEKKPGKSYSRWGGFVNHADCFDAPFFHISPREAEMMDPQQRVLLENVWGLLESSGYTPQNMSRKTGVFIGAIANDYAIYTSEAALEGESPYRNADFYQIPNRISYFFDFHGPSLCIDTACSGSGTALHLACQSILSGECPVAIAGGINLFLHPSRFVQYSQMQIISPDNLCRPFGDDANGTVYGEGIGTVMLKPLAQAEKDQDQILGVIKASTINSGGKTTGFTVPNPNAQGDLVGDAIQKAQIDPRTISYIEAHGTGTALGDPIEVRGLTKAFQKGMDQADDPENLQYCALGSLKANIGHLESGAGIAGLTKILLQMQKKTLVPSLNSASTNPKIAFEETPFYVQKEASEWKAPVIDGTRYPRRAGLSSFGAGGSNFHIVVEEYQPAEKLNSLDASTPQVLIFSARNQQALRLHLQQMRDFFQGCVDNPEAPTLESIAIQLQTGRTMMDERCALCVSNLAEAAEKLSESLEKDSHVEGVFWANAKKNAFPLPSSLNEKEETLERLAECWVAGYKVQWGSLHAEIQASKVSLPTYPFSGKRYWIEEKGKKLLHPLIGENTSSFEGMQFTSHFMGNEFFLADHVIDGKKILPGVAYLEMARVAAESGSPKKVRKLKNIVWRKALFFPEETQSLGQLEVHTTPGFQQGTPEFVISTLDGQGESQIHSRGQIVFQETSDPIFSGSPLDLDQIKLRTQFKPGEECYRLFESQGFQYGKGHQSIQEFYKNDSEALSFLELPLHLKEDSSEYLLHPSIMDGAFQTVLELAAGSTGSTNQAFVPFELGELEIIQKPGQQCFAHVQLQASANPDSPIKKFNITLANPSGEVLVTVKNYAVRVLSNAANATETNQCHLFGDVWEQPPIDTPFPEQQAKQVLIFDDQEERFRGLQQGLSGLNGAHSNALWVKPGERFADLGGGVYQVHPERAEDYVALMECIEKQDLLPQKILHLWCQSSAPLQLDGQLNRGAYSVFFLAQALSKTKKKDKIQLLFTFGNGATTVQPQYAAVASMLKTVNLEVSRLKYKVLELPTYSQDLLLQELKNFEDGTHEVRYEGQNRKVRSFVKLEGKTLPASQGQSPLLRKQGTYIITGGLGGLGLIFARHLAKIVQANLVLVGRSALSPTTEKELRRLKEMGSAVLYQRADLSERSAVIKVLEEARSQFKEIHGIIHSAGVTKDAFLVKKSKAEMDQVIAPKVFGSLHLDEATQNDPLDFFVSFSSMTAVIGNVGQTDYAYGNAFLDHFSEWRENMRQSGLRQGKSLSINWPLWKEGGMQVEKSTEKWLEQNMGARPLLTESGIEVFNQALNFEGNQLVCLEGNLQKIMAKLHPEQKAKPSQTPVEVLKVEMPSAVSKSSGGTDHLLESIIGFAADILKFDTQDIDPEVPFDEYGFDSISLTDLSNQINQAFDLDLTPSVFFEYPSIAALVPSLLEENPELGSSSNATPASPEIQAIANTAMQGIETPASVSNTDTQQELCSIISSLLYLSIEDIDPNTRFEDFGFDSISLTEFSSAINDKYGIETSPSLFFEYNTVDLLVTHFQEEFPETFAVKASAPQETSISQEALPLQETVFPQNVITASHFETPKTILDTPPRVEFSTPRPKSVGQEPIAIIGMDGSFPKSENLEAFWKNLESGETLSQEIPKDRWNWKDYYGDPEREKNKTNAKWGSFLDKVEAFDCSFFGISPKEARLMDPKQRLFLQTVWKSIENSGYRPTKLAGQSVGLFVGVGINDFFPLLSESGEDLEGYTATGGLCPTVLANRISYLLDINGPSEIVDTACSSSTVAIHRAVSSIQSGECDMAIAGGVNTLLSPQTYISLSKSGIISSRDKTLLFNENGDGYVRGEGVGAIILKPLSKAIEDRDYIHGLIRGSAVNHCGNSHSLTSPNPNAQADVMVKALEGSGVPPETISYIEAQGTGTAFGDPIEIKAYKKAFKKLHEKKGASTGLEPNCGIGYLKPVLGHLEAASGIAMMVKTLMAFQKGKLLKVQHLQDAKYSSELEKSPFYLVQENQTWDRLIDESGIPVPRRAGINSFGFGGVNAHLVLEEYINQ